MLTLFFIFDIKKNDIKILCRIFKKIHLINNLKIYILIKNNIVNSKKKILNINKNKVFIDNCGVIVNIFYYRYNKQYIRYIIRVY